jgi:hypothetical protein
MFDDVVHAMGNAIRDDVRDDVRAARGRLELAARRCAPGDVSGTDAVALLEELGVVRRLADGLVAKLAKRVEDSAAHTRGTDRSAAELTARVVGLSPGEARRAISTAAALESLPATDAAVRAGTLSATAAAQIAAGTRDDPACELELLAAARRGPVPLRDAVVAVRARREDSAARRARQRAARSHRMWTTTDGMLAGAYQLPPEEGAALAACIDGETRRIFRAHRSSGDHEPMEAHAADALLHCVTGTAHPDPGPDPDTRADAGTDTHVDAGTGTGAAGLGPAAGPGAAPTGRKAPRSVTHTVHVLVDHAALTRGAVAAGETCEIPGVGPVDLAWVREQLGTAFLTAVVTHGKDVTTVAHLGRHVPAEVRTALVVGGRECCIEGCTARGYLELDHTDVDFAEGGPTALWNLGWECSTHHRLKTQGWILGPPDPTTGKRTLTPPPTPPDPNPRRRSRARPDRGDARGKRDRGGGRGRGEARGDRGGTPARRRGP